MTHGKKVCFYTCLTYWYPMQKLLRQIQRWLNNCFLTNILYFSPNWNVPSLTSISFSNIWRPKEQQLCHLNMLQIIDCQESECNWRNLREHFWLYSQVFLSSDQRAKHISFHKLHPSKSYKNLGKDIITTQGYFCIENLRIWTKIDVENASMFC